ncbi:MAG: hypothetical protein HQK49_18510 [Oligoflexia bacterium]|nr:hypothetical protein [Oligoflexia bacterium]
MQIKVKWKDFIYLNVIDSDHHSKHRYDYQLNKNYHAEITYPNGEKLEGTWEYDRVPRELNGVIIDKNSGKKFTGSFGPAYTGYGTCEYPNGDLYVGSWRDGKEHGQGEMQYKDGSKYVGRWKDGKKKEGKLILNGGKIEMNGYWRKNKPYNVIESEIDDNGVETKYEWIKGYKKVHDKITLPPPTPFEIIIDKKNNTKIFPVMCKDSDKKNYLLKIKINEQGQVLEDEQFKKLLENLTTNEKTSGDLLLFNKLLETAPVELIKVVIEKSNIINGSNFYASLSSITREEIRKIVIAKLQEINKNMGELEKEEEYLKEINQLLWPMVKQLYMTHKTTVNDRLSEQNMWIEMSKEMKVNEEDCKYDIKLGANIPPEINKMHKIFHEYAVRNWEERIKVKQNLSEYISFIKKESKILDTFSKEKLKELQESSDNISIYENYTTKLLEEHNDLKRKIQLKYIEAETAVLVAIKLIQTKFENTKLMFDKIKSICKTENNCSEGERVLLNYELSEFKNNAQKFIKQLRLLGTMSICDKEHMDKKDEISKINEPSVPPLDNQQMLIGNINENIRDIVKTALTRDNVVVSKEEEDNLIKKYENQVLEEVGYLTTK